MMQLVISPDARKDLSDIWDYIATGSIEAADALYDECLQQFELFVAMPNMGKRQYELGTNIRSFPVGRYLIFYSVENDKLTIVRVLHSARDIPTLFGGVH